MYTSTRPTKSQSTSGVVSLQCCRSCFVLEVQNRPKRNNTAMIRPVLKKIPSHMRSVHTGQARSMSVAITLGCLTT